MFTEAKPKSRSPGLRPRSPAVLVGGTGCARLPRLRESRRSCSNYLPYSISDLFALNAESRLFLSPHVVSPSHAHTHILRPPLPPSLWLSGERQLDGTIHLQESSLCHVLLPFPGSRRSQVSNVEESQGRFGAARRGGSALGRPPPSRRQLPRIRCPLFPLLAPWPQLLPFPRLGARST